MAVTSSDIDQLMMKIQHAASEAGIPLLDALVVKKDDVIFFGDLGRTDQILSSAVLSAPSFWMADLDVIESLEDLLEDTELDSDTVPEKFLDLLSSPSQLVLRWVSHGTVFAWLVATNLRQDWNVLLSEAAGNRQEADDAAYEQRVARASELVDHLAADLRFRAAALRERRGLAAILLEGLREPDDTDAVIESVAQRAATKVELASNLAFRPLMTQLDELAGELVSRPEWRPVASAVARSQIAAAFLTEKTGGYGPTKDLAMALRKAADDVPPKTILRLGEVKHS